MSEIPPELIRNAIFAADGVAIGFAGTGAEKTRAILERALESLEANGMIKIVPMEEWPEYFVTDPPYISLFANKGVKDE